MRLVVATVIACAVMIAALPVSPWEFDEPLFFQGLNRYEPLAHHPPPPGYPVFMLVGRILRFVIPSDFATLLVISVIGSAIGFVMLARAYRDIWLAVLFYFSPAMLVHSTLPISEPGALALLASALYCGGQAISPVRTGRIACPPLFAL